MQMIIRGETIEDYNAIAGVNYEAFLGWHPDNPFVTEPMLVDLLRHSALFDPDLSLVAVGGREVVGHVLLAPYRFIVQGAEQPGVVLGPVAVKPGLQRQGIGGKLIEEGHRRAREKGYSFSLLCGHEAYYPRFGYRTRMFSLAGAKVKVKGKGKALNLEGLRDRPIKAEDIPFILKAWKSRYGSASLALFPGETLSDWINYGMECRCLVILEMDRVLGYARYTRGNPLVVKELLAGKGEDIPRILAYLARRESRSGRGEIAELRIAQGAEELRRALAGPRSPGSPETPEAPEAEALEAPEAPESTAGFEVVPEEAAHEAFMIKVLIPGSPMAEYCDRVGKGKARPGIMAFPSMYDVDEGRVD